MIKKNALIAPWAENFLSSAKPEPQTESNQILLLMSVHEGTPDAAYQINVCRVSVR